MIQKMSDQSRIKFTEQTKEIIEQKNSEIPLKNMVNIEDLKSKKLVNSEAIGSFCPSSSILNAGSGVVKDEGGPRKYIGSQTQNSIWDTDVVSKLSLTKDNKEKTAEEKENKNKVKNGIRQETLDYLTEALQETDTRKNSSIVDMSVNASGHQKVSKNSLSIFDTEAFENLPKKTEGEKIAERANKPKEKDTSWRKNGGTVKSNSKFIDSVFENLSKGK